MGNETITTTQDIYASVCQVSEEEKEARKRIRLRDCGKFAWWFDPHTGNKAGYYRRCDNFRECEKCKSWRAHQEKEWLIMAVTSKDLKLKQVEGKSEGNKFVRNNKASKEDYVRYPMEDGTEIIIFQSSLSDEGEDINLKWVFDQDWEEIVCTPEGRNKSGTVHIPPAPEEEEEYTMINAYQLVADVPNGTMNTLMDEVVAETPHLKPETPEEVERDTFTRFLELQRKLREQNIESRTYPKRMKVYHGQIEWKPDFPVKDIKGFNTENLTSMADRVLEKPPN